MAPGPARHSQTWRVAAAFWIFGLTNNFFWVIMLSAALDLVGPSIPKASVLLASVVPSLAAKIITPYILDYVPYALRAITLVGLSVCGMLSVALSPAGTGPSSISSKMAGIVMGSVASGVGEVNYISLTHFYGPWSLAAWGSGTGGAGLVGAGAYALATTALGLSVRTTLLASITVPILMFLSYFVLLPLGPLRAARRTGSTTAYQRVESDDEDNEESSASRLPESAATTPGSESAGLLVRSDSQHFSAYSSRHKSALSLALLEFKAKLYSTRNLLVPYMIPLFLVFLGEYTINQGVAPTLLFPLTNSPFKHFRSFYPTYGAIYQLGVFLSRSSLPFVRIRSLYIPTIFQLVNLLLLTLHALFHYIPSAWFVFIIIFWEGLLGGLVYVSAFAAIGEEVPKDEREFSLGIATMSDAAGILCASILGAIMETALCDWQVRHGRNWCKQL